MRLRLELRLVLHGNVPWMIRNLDYFDQRSVRAGTHRNHARVHVLFAIARVELVTMAVSLTDLL